MKKETVAKFAAPIVTTLGAFVIAGILASFTGEQVGFNSGFLYLFGLYGAKKISDLLKEKMAK